MNTLTYKYGLRYIEKYPALLNDEFFSPLRTSEYERLDKNKQIYLDFTGANLYPKTLVKQHQSLLEENVFGNPHSINPTSVKATKLVESARKYMLEYFNAESDYYCIFTTNATAALQIVGESYPFEDDGHLLLSFDNHNSVNGIREYCKNEGGSFEYCPLHYEDLTLDESFLKTALEKSVNKNRLFAFPAQSNVSGVKHDLGWIKKAREKGWDVLLDAAAFVPTNKLDLQQHKPDFVSVSFYKIFGYPTGTGCLLVHKNTFPKLKKRWFAGGTVSLVSVLSPHHFLQDGHERFENGTVNFLNIPAVENGLRFIQSIGIEKINKRVKDFTCLLLEEMQQLKHDSGTSLVQIFGPDNCISRGGTIIFNLQDRNGNKIPIELAEAKAASMNISLRTGCFCNPGIDEINSCITNDELGKYFTTRNNGDYYDIINYLGKMRGAIRISVGFITNLSDIEIFTEWLRSFLNCKL